MVQTKATNRIWIVIVGYLREIVAAVVRWAGVPLVIRNTICRRRATIVVYHDPKPEDLERHMRYLARRYAFVSLSKLVRALRDRRWDIIPSKALVVTLDDGNMNNTRLIRVFNKYGVSPTVFVCSHLVGTHRGFWWTNADSVVSTVKKIPHRDALDLLKRETGYFPEKEYGSRAVLNGAELRALGAHSEIGSHSCHHPILVNCEDDDCWMEIWNSKSRLHEILNSRIFHFSYPNGDYTQRETTMVAKAGYLSARTLDVGWVSQNADPYRLRAICVQDEASTNILSAQVAGVFQYIHYLIRGSLNGRRPFGLS